MERNGNSYRAAGSYRAAYLATMEVYLVVASMLVRLLLHSRQMKHVVAAVMMLIVCVPAGGADTPSASIATLGPKFAKSPFGRPLILESAEKSGTVRGDVFALVEHPFRRIRSELDTPDEWCEVLILHLNVKTCVAGTKANLKSRTSSLQLTLGTKRASWDDGAHRINFHFRVLRAAVDDFEVSMHADEGPLGTDDYRLSLKATPIASAQSLLHLSYSYTYSTAARLAMSTYLRTIGKEKVGFTVTGSTADGAPVYVKGLRGALERNAMRYYLGIETFLASAAEPPAARRAWRLATWFDATENYRLQLHELTKAEYLTGKEARSP